MTEPEAHQARKAALEAHREAERAVRQAERDLQSARDAELVARQAAADAELAWVTAFDDESRASRRQDQEVTRS